MFLTIFIIWGGGGGGGGGGGRSLSKAIGKKTSKKCNKQSFREAK